MLSARLCLVATSRPCGQSFPIFKSAYPFRTNVKSRLLTKNNDVRHFADSGRGRVTHAFRRMTLAEEAVKPAGDTAFNIGKGALAGGAVIGLGALCYYGLGMSSEAGSIEKSILWPQYVRDRIKTTYMYFGGSVAISLASAVSVFSNPRLLELMSRGGFGPMIVKMGAIIGSGLLVLNLPYSPGLGAKQLAWIGHAALIGGILAPMGFLRSQILLKAAWYTAGIVGGLSTIAVCAPSEKFLNLGGPLAIGLGAVFAASIGSMFLPPTTALGAGLYSFFLYGGLLVFSGSLLYSTQRVIHSAEKYPPDYAVQKPFDPINHSINIYLDVVNMFVLINSILAGFGNSGRKR